DRWMVEFILRDIKMDNIIHDRKVCEEQQVFDVVSLFSGGMDSLISTINFLQEGKRPLLISHAGDGLTKNVQKNVIEGLISEYTEINPIQLNLWMVFSKYFIPLSESENTTRSRSFLFISLGIFSISGIENITKLEVPENALIALNVPLDNLRVGSHSTRTTHPYYLELWNTILQNINLNIKVENKYWNKTKGEMADECTNKKLLKKIIPVSMSCSSPGKVRWNKEAPEHCGYCVPCIIRRAAMQKGFGTNEDKTSYFKASVSDLSKEHENAVGLQLRSFQFAIARVKKNPKLANFLIHKPGPLNLEAEYLNELADVYKRGLLEVENFIQKSVEAEKGEINEIT
ncbi:MAG TPA: Qat anti-phage system QueC-like protein QatC, partial [Clostridium sp.]